MKFDAVINEYKQLLEQDQPVGQPPAPDVAPPAGPEGGQPQGQPTPPPEKKFDKPYQDLAKLLYKALRTDFNTLSDEQKDVILDIVPDGEKSINDDAAGAALFNAVESIVDEQEGGSVTPYQEME